MYYEYLKTIKTPHKLAFIEDGLKITYAEFISRVERCMSYLHEQGLRPNDKAAYALSNHSDFLVLFYAITALGAVAVPLNTMLKASEYEYIFKDCCPKLIIASAHLKEVFEARSDALVSYASAVGKSQALEGAISFDDYLSSKRAPELAFKPERTSLSHIIYTSGTTGLPKGVMLSFGNLLSNIEAIKHDFKITNKDRFIAYLPMFHSFTLTAVCMLPLMTFCTLVIKRSIMPFNEVMAAIFKYRVSILFAIPAILVALQKAKLPWYFRWFNKIRLIISGGNSLAPSTLEAYERTWKRAVLIEGYGLSECSPVVSVNKLQARRAYSVGQPLNNIKVMVVDEDFNELPSNTAGELVVSGECVMLGYLNKPELTQEVKEGSWLRTGDIARIDEDGFIYIVDRKKDIIISKGINIYPREIEDVLMEHEGIKACAVVGIKTKDCDEVIAAYIEPHEDATLSNSEIIGFLKPKIAAYKLPKHIVFMPDLPKNAAGKVLKKNLKERLASE